MTDHDFFAAMAVVIPTITPLISAAPAPDGTVQDTRAMHPTALPVYCPTPVLSLSEIMGRIGPLMGSGIATILRRGQWLLIHRVHCDNRLVEAVRRSTVRSNELIEQAIVGGSQPLLTCLLFELKFVFAGALPFRNFVGAHSDEVAASQERSKSQSGVFRDQMKAAQASFKPISCKPRTSFNKEASCFCALNKLVQPRVRQLQRIANRSTGRGQLLQFSKKEAQQNSLFSKTLGFDFACVQGSLPSSLRMCSQCQIVCLPAQPIDRNCRGSSDQDTKPSDRNRNDSDGQCPCIPVNSTFWPHGPALIEAKPPIHLLIPLWTRRHSAMPWRAESCHG